MRNFGTMKVQGSSLKIANIDLERLRNEYGTPLYIFDEEGLIDNIQVFKDNFVSDKFETRIIYASKAFSNLYMMNIIKDQGLYCDGVSGGELYTALYAGMDSEKIYFHGNNKSIEELEMALDENIGTFVIDNIQEARTLDQLAKEKGKKVSALVRINPGLEAQTHKYIQTTTDDSKFGMSTKDPRTLPFIGDLIKSENIDFRGIHCHIGSQVFDENFFYQEADLVINYAKTIEEEFSYPIKEINLGGGFGVYYTERDHPFDYEDFLSSYIGLIEKKLEKLDLAPSIISIEPGRSLVNNYGHTLYTIGTIKETLAGDPFIFVDGGMSDNPRPALYEAKYTACLPEKMDEEPIISYRIGGKLCESGDILIEKIKLPQAQAGDLLLVPYTGAYNYSMASNYNLTRRPAVVFAKGGNTRLAVRRETYEDLIRYNMK